MDFSRILVKMTNLAASRIGRIATCVARSLTNFSVSENKETFTLDIKGVSSGSTGVDLFHCWK